MACKLYPDWKSNTGFVDKFGNLRDWFDCGEFFYDGKFNVVKLPEGLSLYHGSPGIVKSNVLAPYGIEYFNTNIPLRPQDRAILKDPNIPDSEKNKLIRKIYKPVVAWYGDLSIAQRYSSEDKEGKCGDKCVLAFKLIKPATFIIMNDPMNIGVLLESKKLSLDEKIVLIESQVIGREFTPDEVANIRKLGDKHILDTYNSIVYNVAVSRPDGYDYNRSFNPFMRYQSNYLRRSTMRRPNRPDPYELPNKLNQLYHNEYAGFVNPRSLQDSKSKTARFSEVVFFDTVQDYMVRDYRNKYDWQYNQFKLSKPILDLLNDYYRYTTYNVGFHSGNLLEHSVWSAFYVYNMFDSNNKYHKWVQGIPIKYRDLMTMAALLHDIGKGGDNVTRFYDKPEHPDTGYEYIKHLDDKKYYIGKSTYDIDKIYDSFVSIEGATLNDSSDTLHKQIISLIIRNHYKFGDLLKFVAEKDGIRDPNYFNQIFSNFYNLIMRDFPIPNPTKVEKDLYIRMLVAVSVADVLASQPFVSPDTVPKNATIQFYGFTLSNLSKVWRGTDAYNRFNYDNVGYEIFQNVLSWVK